MGRVTLTLKKVAAFAMCRMRMGVGGRGLGGTYRSFTLPLTKLRDSAFSKREGLHM
jgi:hypothetical protein